MGEVTEILNATGSDSSASTERLLPLVYEELRILAAQRLVHEKPDETLQATALVHEAYLRLVHGKARVCWNSRGHFFAAAAEAMRRILIEQARSKARLRRGGHLRRVDLNQVDLVSHVSAEELLQLDDAIERLGNEDPIAGRLVNLRYFAGLSIAEAASVLSLSTSTAYRHWAYARAWLYCELVESPSK